MILYGPSLVGFNFPCARFFVAFVTLCSTRSPGLILLSLTLWLGYFVIFCFYFFIHCRASSLTSSRKSRSNLQLSSLVSSSKGSLLRLDKPTSIGITTFLPKASLNGVSLVGVLSVVQHVYNTPGSSFSHAPLPSQVEPWYLQQGSICYPRLPIGLRVLGGVEMVLDY